MKTLRQQFEEHLVGFNLSDAPDEFLLALRAFYFTGAANGIVAYIEEPSGSTYLRDEVDRELAKIPHDQESLNQKGITE